MVSTLVTGICQVAEGMLMQTKLAARPSISKMGTTAINNSTYRWFAQRYNVTALGLLRHTALTTAHVYTAIVAQAVALLEID